MTLLCPFCRAALSSPTRQSEFITCEHCGRTAPLRWAQTDARAGEPPGDAAAPADGNSRQGSVAGSFRESGPARTHWAVFFSVTAILFGVGAVLARPSNEKAALGLAGGALLFGMNALRLLRPRQ